MKLFVPALALVLVQFLAPTVSKQQSAVEHKLPNLGAMFLEAEEEALFGNLLNPLKCQDSVDIQDNTIAITVRVLVSKCLNDDQLEDVRVWLTSYVPIGWAVQVAPIAGSCTPTGGMLLSEDDDRFDNIFGDQFTVIDLTNDTDATASTTASNSTVLLGDVPTAKLIGMVSFVDNYNSLQIVQQYETKWSIPSMTTVVCGASDCPSCANCVITHDILMVDSFKFVTTLRCPNLRNAIPVSYLTSSGVRDCVCQCPTGYKRAANGKDCDLVGGTTSTCSWAAPNGFKIENQAPLSTCSFSHISDSGVPVPVAIDNYVAKGRTNTYTTTSDLSTGPHIDLKTSRVSTQKVLNVNSATAFPPSSSYPASYSGLTSAQLAGVMTETDGSDGATPVDTLLTWEDYRSARKAKVDAFTYSSYGKYALEIDATDYESGAASCQGCVAIVDKKRPTATVSCMTATSSDLVPTSANIQTINTKIDAYFSYQSTASNDACSTGSRCDYEHVDTRALFASAYSTGTISHSCDAAKAFFSAQGVRTAVDALAPFTDAELATDTPVADGQCKSCLKLTSSLREWWIDYSCGRDYAVKKCEGDSTQSCTFEQCYVLSGSTISSANAAIKGTVQTESQKVLNQIEDRARFNTQTQVHIAIPLCTEFKTSDIPDACKQTANVNDFFDFNSPDAGVLGFSSTELDSLVKWRYKINTDPWAALHSNSPSYTFTQAVTPVVVEAWTKCGRVYSFEFKIHLHISTAPVCDQFLSMWYQTTHAPFNPTTTLCTYPKADFAEVTFDYTANQGLMYSKDKLNMHIQEVECRLQYKWLASGTGAKATVVSSTTPNTNIIKRIGVLAKRLSQTTEYTEFTVACDFRYSVFEKTDLLVKTCTQDFTIKDCTSPKIDEPSALTDKSCAADSCVGNSAPSAYEACGGNIVSANGQDTVLTTTEQACCPFCSPTYTTACKKLPQLPTGVDEIKLCIPHLASAPAADYDDGPNLLAADAVSPSNEVPSTTVILLGVSAMVAVVALVVERRRRASAAAKAADDDAYYVLLG